MLPCPPRLIILFKIVCCFKPFSCSCIAVSMHEEGIHDVFHWIWYAPGFTKTPPTIGRTATGGKKKNTGIKCFSFFIVVYYKNNGEQHKQTGQEDKWQYKKKKKMKRCTNWLSLLHNVLSVGLWKTGLTTDQRMIPCIQHKIKKSKINDNQNQYQMNHRQHSIAELITKIGLYRRKKDVKINGWIHKMIFE